MSTETEETLDVREQLARLDKLRAETTKIVLETRMIRPGLILQGGLTLAALAGAVVAVVKIFE